MKDLLGRFVREDESHDPVEYMRLSRVCPGVYGGMHHRNGDHCQGIGDAYLGISPRHAVLQMVSVTGSIWILENVNR